MAGEPQAVENNENSTGKLLGGITGKGFMPGQSGNAGGRPKRKPLTDALNAALSETVAEEIRHKLNLKDGATYAEVLALSIVREAVTGKNKVQAFAEIADRVEGKVTQSISGTDGGAIEIKSVREMTEAEIDARLAELRGNR